MSFTRGWSRSSYTGKEKGLSSSAHIVEEEISLYVLPEIGLPTGTWEKDGWSLTSMKYAKVGLFSIVCIHFDFCLLVDQRVCR